MKILVVRRTAAIMLAAAVVLLCGLSFALSATGAYAVYFNGTLRELPIYCVDTEQKKIAISFDCAWGVEYTDQILKHTADHNVKCTFFMVEFWATKYPDYVKKIHDAGHEIGTHSSTHSYMSRMNETDIIKEIQSSSKAIGDVTGEKVTLFRAPYGDYNDRLIKTVASLGLQTVQWDVDSLDWKNLSASDIALRIVNNVKNGSIILCHNNGRHTAEALPIVFSNLQNKGYEFVKIGDLVYKQNYIIDATGKQKTQETN